MPVRRARGTKRLLAGWASAPSEAHRVRNEDAFFVLPERGFFGVFDGMGGHAHADLASRIAAEEVAQTLLPLAPDASDEAAADAIRDAFLAADDAVRTEAPSRGIKEMGTTALVAIVRPASRDGWSALVGWVGDSRAYLLGAGGRALQPLTLDDSVVRLHATSSAQAQHVQAMLGDVTDQRGLTLRQRDFFLERHMLLQAVGASLQHVHIGEHQLGDGDQLLLATDGVHDNLTDREMAVILRRTATVGDAARRLVAAARARSRQRSHLRSKPDDMTAIVIRLGAGRT